MVIWVTFYYCNITYVGFDFNVFTLASIGNMLTFMVGSKQAFEVSIPDVAQTQMQGKTVAQTQMQGKTDVLIEFHVDDTTGSNEVCSGP